MRNLALLSWVRTIPDNWTYYASLTFRTPQGPSDAVMKLRSWLSHFQTGAWWVNRILYSVEPHQTGAAHIHALLETSLGPLPGHCERCDHAPDGSCKRVYATGVNKKTGETYRYRVKHGSRAWDPTWKRLNESWACHFGWARFEDYDPSLKFGAYQYVMKYLFKSDMMDWGYLDGEDFPL